MLRHHVTFYLPRAPGEMMVVEALDFPGAVRQGFDLADPRLMIGSALEDLAQALIKEGRPLPVPSAEVQSSDVELIEFVPLAVYAGAAARVCGGGKGSQHTIFVNRATGVKLQFRGTERSTIASLVRSAVRLECPLVR